MTKLSINLRKLAAALRGISPIKPLQPLASAAPGKATASPLGPPQMKQDLKGLPNPTASRSSM